MTIHELPAAGAAGPDLARSVRDWWAEAAARAGLDLAGFRPDAPFAERAAWATARGLAVAAVLSRFSTKLQHSTDAQVRECVEWAARNRVYVPPELVCVDEAVTGKKADRAGLGRAKAALAGKLAAALLVYKVSRLFRVAHLGYQFFHEHLVEAGLRGVSVTQNIDTADEKAWKPLAYLHGLIDEMFLTSVADHVRTGLRDLFARGYVTGALTVGYVPVPVAGAPPTNLGRPRTVPGVDPKVAAMIVQHYEWVRDGMSIKEGWRRWVRAGGPCDRRSRVGRMSYGAYRRMLSNPRYTGVWAFGRKRNVWSTRKDGTRQMPRPDADVTVVRCEDLRVVSNALFAAVQARLAVLATGPRGPRRRAETNLWDLTTECFWCPRCDARFHTAGAGGKGMRCKNGDLCPAPSAVRRKDAVAAVCGRLGELLAARPDLVDRVVARGGESDAGGAAGDRVADLERKEAGLRNKVADLTELAGDGDEAERAALKAKVRAVRAELAGVRADLAAAQAAAGGAALPSGPELRAALADLSGLLADGAAGRLGPDAVYRAAAAFRLMVGGRVWVHVEARPGKKHTVARGVFRPDLLRPAGGPPADGPADVEVWLRPPPRIDRLADRVHDLVDGQGQSYRAAAATLRAEGEAVNSGNVWYAYRRYYAMRGLPVPDRPYNNGHPRRTG